LSAVEADFVALARARQSWTGEWLQLIFLDSPTTDPNFRYLRTLLLQDHCFPLKRGVYLHAGELSKQLINTLQHSYRQSLLVIKCGSWQFGDEQIVIGQKAGLSDLLSVYSGISTELDNLLTKIDNEKSLSVRQKEQIASIFERFVTVLQQDTGILPYYYPQVKTGWQLLSQLVQGVGGVVGKK
jgi:hypothetical protein